MPTTKPMTTTVALIAEARKLDAEATPGGWLASEYLDDGRIGILTDSNDIVVALKSGIATKQDAAFIARSRTLLPQLADALEAAEQNVNDLNGILAKTLAAGDYRAGLLEAKLAKVQTSCNAIAVTIRSGRVREVTPAIAEAWANELDRVVAEGPFPIGAAAPDCPARPMEPTDG